VPAPSQLAITYGCGCSYVNWRVPARHLETHGWHLCPEHMTGFQAFRTGNRREFRIKYPCRCYYVLWRTAAEENVATGWGLCQIHMDELRAFVDRAESD
jgi:hypothetical protein